LTLIIPIGAALGYVYNKWADKQANPQRSKRMGVLMATGLIVGESLFGVINAGIIAATSNGDALAVVGESFAGPAKWIGALAFAGLCVLTYGRLRTVARRSKTPLAAGRVSLLTPRRRGSGRPGRVAILVFHTKLWPPSSPLRSVALMAASAPRGDNPSQSSTPRASRAIRGAVHRALKTLTTPLLPTDIAGLFNPLAGRELRGRLEAVSKHGELTTLKITPSRGTQLSFRPGQFIGLGVQIDGRWQWRCFSITNAPRPNLGSVTLGIKQVPDGAVSTHIATVARVGDIIRLSQPGGEFYLSHPVPNKLFFLTAGSGITPVIS